MRSKKSDTAGTRTLGPLIKSQLLYQLSYGVNSFKAIELVEIKKAPVVKKDDWCMDRKTKNSRSILIFHTAAIDPIATV